MTWLKQCRWNRRDFLGALAILGGSHFTLGNDAEDPSEALERRAIVGDVAEPKWDSGITLTVGPEKADLVGTNEKVIQAAVDYVGRWGGGTVRILPGTYHLRNAVFLQSRVRIVGSGPDSTLIKEPSVKTTLAEDSDFYEQEITLADPSGFQVGDGVCLQARSLRNGETDVFTRALVARTGSRFKLDRPLPGYPGFTDLWIKGDANATTLFALICGEGVSDVTIENITLDGNKAHNEFLNGNHVACLFLRGCNGVAIKRLTTRNFNGDGISWQGSHDVRVEECHSHDNEGLGLHPGSGSQRPVALKNKLEHNDIGFYFCWGAQQGRVERNVISNNRRYGVSIGHKDTGNAIRHNEITGNGEVGVLFRKEEAPAFAPSRNRLEDNRILDNGGENGIGVDVQGETDEIIIARNEIRETRQPLKRIGVRIGAQARNVKLEDNRIEGFSSRVLNLK